MWRAGLARHTASSRQPGYFVLPSGDRSFLANRKCRNANKKLYATNKEKELHLIVQIPLVCDAQDEVTILSREG